MAWTEIGAVRDMGEQSACNLQKMRCWGGGAERDLACQSGGGVCAKHLVVRLRMMDGSKVQQSFNQSKKTKRVNRQIDSVSGKIWQNSAQFFFELLPRLFFLFSFFSV